ncbi:hypothetical protein NTJ12_002469 [Flavobacterium psychrophilum]|nr:hypothetical protein [Flavobacterium psychrophilum]
MKNIIFILLLIFVVSCSKKDKINHYLNKPVTESQLVENGFYKYSYTYTYENDEDEKDRVTESWENVKNEILDYAYNNPYTPTDNVSKTEGKVVVLMHERAFRKGLLDENKKLKISDETEINKLKSLIEYFKSIKADFKTMDNY